MAVNSKSVAGRRSLKFLSLENMLGDAERLAAAPKTRTLGNWDLGHLLTHLASTIENSIDGFQVKAPWFVRLIGPFLKKGMLQKMSPGIQLPKKAISAAFPPSSSVQASLQQLRQAVARSKTKPMTADHPAFGKMTHDEWYQLHLRHAEMHLSFAVPE